MPVFQQKQKPVVAVVASDITAASAIEALAEEALTERFDLHFFFLCRSRPLLAEALLSKGVGVTVIGHKGWVSLLKNILLLAWRLGRIRAEVVHTHLLHANLAGLWAAALIGVPKRFHTRHHSDPYHHKFKHGRLYDWMAQKLSTKIVATCENGRRVLNQLEGVPEEKIVKIPFGVRVEDFVVQDQKRLEKLRNKYQIGKADLLVGAVSRSLEIKGLQYLIPAFQKFLSKEPGAVLVLAGSTVGSYRSEVRNLLLGLPQESYREVDFEQDMPAFYSVIDIFAHVPVNSSCEAFGQVYLEALAAGRASIFTLSGVAPEFIENSVNAVVVPFQDSASITSALDQLGSDSDLRMRLGQAGRERVREMFPIQKYWEAHQRLWEK